MSSVLKKIALALLLLNPLVLSAGAKTPVAPDCAKEATKAEQFYLNGKTQLALYSFDKCFKNNQKDKEAFLFFIKILPENSPSPYYEDLLKTADTALKETSDNYIAYLALCKYYRNKKQINKALSNCKKALMLEPIAYPVYRELGLTYKKTKNSEKAMEYFKQAVELSSNNYKVRFLLAEEYLKANKNNLALKNYLKAFRLLPPSEKDTLFASTISKRVKIAKDKLAKKNKFKQKKTKTAKRIKVKKCIDKANAYSDSDRLEEASAQISTCLKMDSFNSKARMFSADILMRLGKYENSIEAYKTTAKTKETPREIRAFCQIKIGDIYSKMKNNKLAIFHYQKSLEINNVDINALLKIAKCHEKDSNHKKALYYYERIIKVEPGNTPINLKIKELKVKTMSNKDILAEMKLRLFIDKKTETLSKDIKDLFHLTRQAENRYAVDYLKDKNVILTGNIVNTRNKAGKFKLLLNARGFKSYRWLMTREAIRFFEKKEINLKTVFVLRDKKGAIIFDKKGNLTNEGLVAYWEALEGEKSWLMPYEKPPANTRQEKENKEIGKLRKDGYREIIGAELAWLLKATDCPIDVLMLPEKDYLRIVKTEKEVRYFLCYQTPSTCSKTGHGAILATYMEKYRAGDRYIPTGKTSTAFFGTGAVERKNFCHEGKIWGGK
jgi:tetratricopeptide (TPR) repeat protein